MHHLLSRSSQGDEDLPLAKVRFALTPARSLTCSSRPFSYLVSRELYTKGKVSFYTGGVDAHANCVPMCDASNGFSRVYIFSWTHHTCVG